MSRLWLVFFSVVALSLSACGGEGGNPVSQQGVAPSPDAVPDAAPDAVPDGSPEATPDAEPDGTPDGINPFEECGDSNGSCAENQTCVNGVCVTSPAEMSLGVVGLERGDRVIEVGAPNLDCYRAATPTSGEVEYVEIRGEIEKFGVGGSTVGLCVTIFNNDRFLADRATRCSEVQDDDFDYEECLQLDPCRCEKDNEGDAAATDDCFSSIGYCAGIGDAGKKDSCSQGLAYDGNNDSRDPAMESTLIYGHMIAVVPPSGDTDKGSFSISGVPTNTELTIKVSGKIARWVDTYEFGGMLVNPREDTEDRDGDGDTSERFVNLGGNVISIGAWNTIPSTALVPSGIQQGNGAIAGRINDCGEEGRTVEIEGETIDASATLPIENATVGFTHDPTRTTYFNGNPSDTLPQPGRITTNKLAVYAAINAPGGFNRISTATRLEGEGVLPIGTRDLFLSPRSVGILTFEGNYEPAPW